VKQLFVVCTFQRLIVKWVTGWHVFETHNSFLANEEKQHNISISGWNDATVNKTLFVVFLYTTLWHITLLHVRLFLKQHFICHVSKLGAGTYNLQPTSQNSRYYLQPSTQCVYCHGEKVRGKFHHQNTATHIFCLHLCINHANFKHKIHCKLEIKPLTVPPLHSMEQNSAHAQESIL